MDPEGRLGAVPPTLASCQKVRILLVDDFEPIRKLMLLLLEGHNEIAEVREAGDGFSAIDLCSEFEPDLVLLDFWMPGMDGAEVAERIKRLHPKARIVAYSAVLQVVPNWADDLVIKDAVPDPDRLVRLAKGA